MSGQPAGIFRFDHKVRKETLFHCESERALAKDEQRGCGVSILGDIQKQSGHSPGQPTLGDPA